MLINALDVDAGQRAQRGELICKLLTFTDKETYDNEKAWQSELKAQFFILFELLSS